jgi:choline kinase
MKAVMLAAGIGNRLSKDRPEPPKVLLRFAGKSLLERHIANLKRCGVTELVIGVGYEAQMILDEVKRLGVESFVRTVHNPRFRDGSGITLASLGGEFACGRDVLLMDGDVLYDERILKRLIDTKHKNCLLLDRDFEPGDEPVKICVRGDQMVDFHKKVQGNFDLMGESVGFFRFAPDVARDVLARCRFHIDNNEPALWYEESIRDVLLARPAGTFGYEDVTGLAWIEIDFPDDVQRAEREILPHVEGVRV